MSWYRCARLTRIACGTLGLLVVGSGVCGCSARYVASMAADLSSFSAGDGVGVGDDAQAGEAPDRRRAQHATLPARVAIARVQSGGWGRHAGSMYLASFDSSERELLEEVGDWALVTDTAPVTRLLAPSGVERVSELLAPARSLGADLLLVMTYDTDDELIDAAPLLGLGTLGIFPTISVESSSVASALLVDAHSGRIYASGEGADETSQLANGWTSSAAEGQARKRAERRALASMLENLDDAWDATIAMGDVRVEPSETITIGGSEWRRVGSAGGRSGRPAPRGSIYRTHER